MLFKDITILDETLTVKENMYVGIRNDTITYIGSQKPKEDYKTEYCGKGKLLMSGFVNAHAHTPMALLRGYGENMALSDWLNKRIFPYEDKLNEQDVYYGTLLGIAEMLRFGTVSATDMYFFGEAIAKAVLESGFKSNLGVALVSEGDQDLESLISFHQVKSLYQNYHNAENGRLKIDMSIHAEYTSTPKMVSQFANYCKGLGANMHIHLSETKQEHISCKQRHNGKTPAEYFNSLGVFDRKTTAAHCVWIEGQDFDILKEKNVTVATCPVSNLKLASGVCNVPKLLDKGISVAIGTDSAASNNSLDMIEEMKFFSLINKGVQFDPTVITPEEAVNAATYSGMVAQGRENSGKIKEGYRADLIVLDISKANMHPVHSLVNNIVYSAKGSDVLLTMVDGKVLYQNGEYTTIDLEKVIYEVEKINENILNKLK